MQGTSFSIISLCVFNRIQLVNQLLTSSQCKVSNHHKKMLNSHMG